MELLYCIRMLSFRPRSAPVLKGGSGDVVEIMLAFTVKNATSFGLRTRISETFSCDIVYSVETKSISAGSSGWWKLSPNVVDSNVMRIFIDRSVVEVFVGGSALTGRCILPHYVDPNAANFSAAELLQSTGTSRWLKFLRGSSNPCGILNTEQIFKLQILYSKRYY